jgi:Zn-dependent protease with chaperone function
MDFFQRQQIARRNTKLLEVYFALSIIGTVVTIYAGCALIFFAEGNLHNNQEAYDSPNGMTMSSLWDTQLFLIVSFATLAAIFFGSLYKMAQLSRGGSVVAEMLGGQPIDSGTRDVNERRLLNVVEEMAIASGTPVPHVYLLTTEKSINAFAAGHSTGDMVVCVTGGALKYLTRDELQGVIGHEFSHILNGDMRLNLRLMGIIFGILCLTIIGRILLQTRGRKNPLPLFGLVLILVGSIGIFFSKLIKSAVSRQREFLADAASVQFTRNPAGLASALKKVGSFGSHIDDPNAEDASHFFFANGLTDSLFGWMSTHPPLEERIRELDPSWDGTFTAIQEVDADAPDPDSQTDVPPERRGFGGPMGNLLGAGILASGAGAGVLASSTILPSVGQLTAGHLDYASDIMAAIPDDLTAASRNPMSAVALIYALLLSSDESARNAQLQGLQDNPAIFQETLRLLPFVQSLNSKARLPLVTLSITALRVLSAPQYDQFTRNLQALTAGSGQPDLFAYVLQKIVQRRLDSRFHPAPERAAQYYALKPALLPDCAVLLSTVACAGQTEPADIQSAFDQGRQQLDLTPEELQLDMSPPDFQKIDAALNRLNLGTPQMKKAVLNACAASIAADGLIQENEVELLRAISDTLDCPIPPFLNV